MSKPVLETPVMSDETGQDIVTALETIASGLAPNASGTSFESTGCKVLTANTVQGALVQVDDAIDNTNSSLTQLGTFYSYSWTANSSNSFGAQLTQAITLPKGVYILVGVAPILSVTDFTIALYANKSINAPFLYNAIRNRTPIIFTFQVTEDNTDVWLSAGGSTSITYTNISEGSGRIIRVR